MRKSSHTLVGPFSRTPQRRNLGSAVRPEALPLANASPLHGHARTAHSVQTYVAVSPQARPETRWVIQEPAICTGGADCVDFSDCECSHSFTANAVYWSCPDPVPREVRGPILPGNSATPSREPSHVQQRLTTKRCQRRNLPSQMGSGELRSVARTLIELARVCAR